MHAICDAVLGALGEEDSAISFPIPTRAGGRSQQNFSGRSARQTAKRGGRIVNVDATVIAQRRKSIRTCRMKQRIAAALSVTTSQIGVKATTNEHLVSSPREGIAARPSLPRLLEPGGPPLTPTPVNPQSVLCIPKAEISWKRPHEQAKNSSYAQHIGREWKFFHRAKRFDVWRPVKERRWRTWLELLDAVQRLSTAALQPDDESPAPRHDRDRFPEADVSRCIARSSPGHPLGRLYLGVIVVRGPH